MDTFGVSSPLTSAAHDIASHNKTNGNLKENQQKNNTDAALKLGKLNPLKNTPVHVKTPETEVVSSFDPKSGHFWLDVVNKETGKVVSKIPPEVIRKMADSYARQGLFVDKFR